MTSESKEPKEFQFRAKELPRTTQLPRTTLRHHRLRRYRTAKGYPHSCREDAGSARSCESVTHRMRLSWARPRSDDPKHEVIDKSHRNWTTGMSAPQPTALRRGAVSLNRIAKATPCWWKAWND